MKKTMFALAVLALASIGEANAIAVVAARPVMVARPAPVMVRPVSTPYVAPKPAVAPSRAVSGPIVPVIIPHATSSGCSEDRRKKNQC